MHRGEERMTWVSVVWDGVEVIQKRGVECAGEEEKAYVYFFEERGEPQEAEIGLSHS
jgi:hypothetical protein